MSIVSPLVEVGVSQSTLVVASIEGNELVLVGVKVATVRVGDGVNLALLSAVVIAGRDGSLPVDPPASTVSVCIEKRCNFND